MKESTFRRRVVQLLHKFSAFSVENPAWPGTPDVCTTAGWIELKVLRAWPKRTIGGIVRLPHLTQVQRLWHMHWTRAGGRSFLLLLIENDVLLIDARDLDKVGFVGKQELLDLALGHWTSLRHMDAHLEMAIRPGIH